LFFSCCDSAAAPRQRPWQNDQVPAKYIEGRRGNGLGTTIKHLRNTLRGAAGIGLGTSIKYPRRATGAAAATAGRNDEVPAKNNERRRGLQSGHHDK
jgi:hypothetical protein